MAELLKVHQDIKGVKTEMWLINPKLAEELLAKNVSNRRIIHRRVERYARKMRAGQWPFIGDPICFSREDVLLNGQHRLWAVVVGKVELYFNVVLGLPAETQRFMDQGRNRTAANQLSIEGVANPVAASALSRFVIAWDDKAIVSRKNDSVTNDDIAEFVEEHPDRVQDAIVLAERVRSNVPIMSIGAAAAVAFKTLEIDEAAATQFFDMFAIGANLDDGNPVLMLRNHLAKLRRQRTNRTAGEIAYLIVTTWNAWYAGRTNMQRLQLPKGGVTDQNFPSLLIRKGGIPDADSTNAKDQDRDQLATAAR